MAETDQIIEAHFTLPKQELKDLRKLAEKRGVTPTHVLKDAIRTENFVDRVENQGGRLLVFDSKGRFHRVIRRPGTGIPS